MSKTSISMYEKIGKGYTRGWWTNCHCRYRVFKGARNTKKSYVIIGLEVIDKVLSDSRRNVLILRQIGANNRYSTFATLDMLINLLRLDRHFKVNSSNMTITYLPTGQQIIFAGMYPNPTRITSMRMPRGYLTDVYVEEAFEIVDYEGWRKIDGTIRGKLPEGLFHQITFCFNAWNKDHWLYEHFFKGRLEDNLDYLLTHNYQDWRDESLVIDYGKGLYLHISTYKINEFRDKDIYDVAMEQLRAVAPEIYKVEALGLWGNSTDGTYPEFTEDLEIPSHQALGERYAMYAIGIDFGISNGEGKLLRGDNVRVGSATTMQLCGVTSDYSKMICIDEFFHSNERELVKKTGPELQHEMVSLIKKWRDEKYRAHPDLMKGRICVYVDSADSGGFRQGLELEARKQGMMDVVFMPSTKISIQSRVDFVRLLMAWGEFLVSKNCPNLIREMKNARHGEKGEVRADCDDHAINANEYAWAPMRERIRRWKTFKEH